MPPAIAAGGLRPHAAFLDAHFASPSDLASAPALSTFLSGECDSLSATAAALSARLCTATAACLSRSADARSLLRSLPEPRQLEGSPMWVEDAVVEDIVGLFKQIEKLEAMQAYAETVLKLEALVGNLEDAAFAVVRQNPKSKVSLVISNSKDIERKHENLLRSVEFMRDIEDELVRIYKHGRNWSKLVMAVDIRVEKTLSILRPQALTDHRTLLAALGWPPSLLTSGNTSDKFSEVSNPLLLMDGKKKEIYCQSFLALCALQHLQARRELRQHLTFERNILISDAADVGRSISFDDGLWAVDELAHPIASKIEYHFTKWSDQPEFVFALVYKITKDIMDGVDDVLQPLIDQARLAGLSAKEAWVTSMVKILVGYLEKQVFPALVSAYRGSDKKQVAISSWLNMIDLMISFNKRMQLLSTAGIHRVDSSLETEELSRSLSILTTFNDHSNWIEVWAEVELLYARDRLAAEMAEKNWLSNIRKQNEGTSAGVTSSFLLNTREEYKAPVVADFVIKLATSMIERGRALPNKARRSQFVRLSAACFLMQFFVDLRQFCEDAMVESSNTEDDYFLRVTSAINAARYCEYIIQGWDEHVTFLDISPDEIEQKRSFFADEIAYLIKLETDYLELMMSAILQEFELFCSNYTQDNEQWEELNGQTVDEENVAVSPGLVEALNVLRDHIAKLQLYLNSKDFFDLWRSIAEGLDYFLYRSIQWGDIRFSNLGVIRLKVDIRALFHIFSSLCVRPAAFFPCISECLKLLTLSSKDAELVLKEAKETDKNRAAALLGLHHIKLRHAKKILRNRNFEE